MELKDVDIHYNFINDTPNFWNGFWERRAGLGMFDRECDPDSRSLKLIEYQRKLYRRKLPNGNFLDLNIGKESNNYYLYWKSFKFSSDTIITNFRFKYYPLIWRIKSQSTDYKVEMTNFMNVQYTIGSHIFFPKRMNSINMTRGSWSCTKIRDRWDLTLECIRLFYEGIENPLTETLNKDEEFFKLFVDFKGYIDFFFLQDCVTENKDKVILWQKGKVFLDEALPQTLEDYDLCIKKQIDFAHKRNERIQKYIDQNEL